MDWRPEGRTALVTGGGSGIGRALARELAVHGCRVIICGRREAALAETAASFDGIEAVVADLSTEEGQERVLRRISGLERPIDLLVNNAGIQRRPDFAGANGEGAVISEIAEECRINLLSPIQLTARMIPYLARPGGVILNVTSVLAWHPKKSAPVYCATKAGLSAFSRGLRLQLAGSGIRVMEAVPPLVDTDMTRNSTGGKIKALAVAEAILTGLTGNREQILIGKAKAASLINRLAPGILARMLSGM